MQWGLHLDVTDDSGACSKCSTGRAEPRWLEMERAMERAHLAVWILDKSVCVCVCTHTIKTALSRIDRRDRTVFK